MAAEIDTRRAPGFAQLGAFVRGQGALLALALLTLFGALRYDGFFGVYNITEVLRYNAMFGLIALGMTFVIITGGIDLSVGAVAALCSVIAALLSGLGPLPTLLLTTALGALIGLINGGIIVGLGIQPFIATLVTLLAARGAALLLASNGAVTVDTASGFIQIGTGGLGSVPYVVALLAVAYALGALALRRTRFGRYALAVGGNEEAARLMGLPVQRVKLGVYVLSGALAGLAGVLLASLTLTGLPTEGVGWELTAIAAVVVGGTLLSGGVGSVGTTLAGVLLLGLTFNILNFENGRGVISLSVYWQSVIRGLFLLVVVLIQSRLARRS